MEQTEKRYSMPEKYIVIPRNGWFVLFDPVHFSFARVNEHGKAILDAVGSETLLSEVVARVVSRHGFAQESIEQQVAAFLANMTVTRFVHEGPYKPERAEPADMTATKPGSLYLHPTFRCNLQCIYCYNKKERKESACAELTTEEWFGVMDQAKEFGIRDIVFTGGEPLLRNDIFDLARYANGIGLTSQLLTNALLIKDGNIDNIIHSFGSVGFSLDSHVEERNDFLRGPGAFQATLRAIKRVKEGGRTFNAKAVITKHNVKDLPALYEFFLGEFGTGSLVPNLFIPPSREMVDLLPELEDYLEATTKAHDAVAKFYGDDALSVLRFHGVPARQYQCGAAAGELSIGPDGSVYPCQSLQKKEFNAGNVKERSLKDIYYDSPVMKQLRGCTVDAIDTCRDCDIKYLCGGGCRSLAYNLFGTIDCYNSYSCEYLKNLAYGILWNSSCIPIDQLRNIQATSKVAAKAGSCP